MKRELSGFLKQNISSHVLFENTYAVQLYTDGNRFAIHTLATSKITLKRIDGILTPSLSIPLPLKITFKDKDSSGNV